MATIPLTESDLKRKDRKKDCLGFKAILNYKGATV